MMFRLLAVLALAGAVLAQQQLNTSEKVKIATDDGNLKLEVPRDKDITFERARRDEAVSVWGVNDRLGVAEAKLSELAGIKDAFGDQLKENLDAAVRVLGVTTQTVQATVEARAHGLELKIFELQASVKKVTDTAETNLAAIVNETNDALSQSVAAASARAQQQAQVDRAALTKLKGEVAATAAAATAGVNKALKSVQATSASLLQQMDVKIAAAVKKVDQTVGAAVGAEAKRADAEIKKLRDSVTGLIKQEAISKYMKNSWQSASYHSNRRYFKVLFNLDRPGYFTNSAPQFRSTCSKLTADLKAVDGIDRALKPICNHASYTDGNCHRIPNTYLSHCGCGGYPTWPKCAGMPEDMLKDTILYSSTNWNGHSFLSHNGVCSHSWRGANSQHATVPYTVCTSANGNFAK